jgi:hypothetical protein
MEFDRKVSISFFEKKINTKTERNVPGDYYGDSLYFCFWIILFTSFTSGVSLRELKTKCRNLILFWRSKRTVGPQILKLTDLKVGQAAAVAPTIR